MIKAFLLLSFLVAIQASIIVQTALPLQPADEAQSRAVRGSISESEPPAYEDCVTLGVEIIPVIPDNQICSIPESIHRMSAKNYSEIDWLRHLGCIKPVLFLFVALLFGHFFLPNGTHAEIRFMFDIIIFLTFLFVDIAILAFKITPNNCIDKMNSNDVV
jgi:hypothetical protein